jgi:hypothetical protein
MLGMEMEDDDGEALLIILEAGALKQQGSCTRNPIETLQLKLCYEYDHLVG